MPKVEIELDELIELKNLVEESKTKFKEYQDEINLLNPSNIDKRIIDLAQDLFTVYIQATLKSIGFNEHAYGIVRFDGLDRWSLKDHFNFDINKIKVSISAHISDAFRDAYLKIGVIPDETKIKSYLDFL